MVLPSYLRFLNICCQSNLPWSDTIGVGYTAKDIQIQIDRYSVDMMNHEAQKCVCVCVCVGGGGGGSHPTYIS